MRKAIKASAGLFGIRDAGSEAERLRALHTIVSLLAEAAPEEFPKAMEADL